MLQIKFIPAICLEKTSIYYKTILNKTEKLKTSVLYLSYDGILEPLGQSQVFGLPALW
jgi:hypothetical protein